jgi:glycosyltransferase involved in cell wall biosynthesis
LCRVRADLVHTLGAIVPNRVDIADLHFCHAGFLAATGHLAPAEAPPLRRLNTSLARFLALSAERWCYRPTRLRRFAAVSEGVAAELVQYYPGVPVSVVPNGVDLDRYDRDPEARQTVRAAEGVADDDVVALFVGGDWDRKGLPLIIEALSHAPRVRLWVMGPGNESRATAHARRFGVEDRLHILGPRTDGERYYSASDLFCLASLYETFSLAAHEAAAAHLPIISTPVSGINELVGNDEAGILVARSAEAFGASLERLASDPSLRDRLGSTARERVAKRTWEAAASAMLATDAELLANREEQAR